MPNRPMSEESNAKRRVRLKDDDGGGLYFASTDPSLKFVHTGSTVLDCTIGGGWPLGRVVNVIGDQSTGKTLLAIEAMSNFARQYPEGGIRYYESESAFSQEYASTLGLPLNRVSFKAETDEGDTVENFYRDLDFFLKKLGDRPGFYVLDSLDALSDEAEVAREFGQDSYGTGKAKQLSQLFRRITGKIASSETCLMIVSQTRDRIATGFGRKYTRSGGRALDFYASIIIYLAHVGEITRTVGGVKRPIGVEVKARCTKNKVSLPFRNATFPIIFGYGVEDVSAGLDWLNDHKLLDLVDLSAKDYKEIRTKALRIGLEGKHEEWRKKVSKAVKQGYRQVETSFLPKRKKYT